MADVRTHLLPYANALDHRATGAIRRVVIHATELPDLATAREYGNRIHHPDSATGNSGHFYIDRDGTIEQWVPLDRVAHHVRDHNADTIGIELVNRGRWPDWFDSNAQDWTEIYPEAQIAALIELLVDLKHQLPQLRGLVGHDQLDTASVTASDDPEKQVRRKTDPGTRFPWSQVIEGSSMARLEP